MPIRSFRSSAFSPLATQQVRFIPYTYIAPPVDGPGPVIYNQPQDAENPPGAVVIFSLEAIGEGDITYQWQMKPPVAESVWANISDSGTFTGTQSRVLYVNGVVAGSDQTFFRCIVTNVGGSTTSDAVSFYGSI